MLINVEIPTSCYYSDKYNKFESKKSLYINVYWNTLVLILAFRIPFEVLISLRFPSIGKSPFRSMMEL